jgi:hypothetical protein
VSAADGERRRTVSAAGVERSGRRARRRRRATRRVAGGERGVAPSGVAPSSAPSAADLELAFVEKFFWSQGREPYPVQEQAIAAIVAGLHHAPCAR